MCRSFRTKHYRLVLGDRRFQGAAATETGKFAEGRVKPDEAALLKRLQADGWCQMELGESPGHRRMPRYVIAEMDINEKRALYILDKWTDKGWWEYGTVVDGGWLTTKGMSINVPDLH